MSKKIKRLFTLFLSVCLLAALSTSGAWATTTNTAEERVSGSDDPQSRVSVSSDTNRFTQSYEDGEKYGTGSTNVTFLNIFDGQFDFAERSKAQNFTSVDEAKQWTDKDNTNPRATPLRAYLYNGYDGTTQYEVVWSIDVGYLNEKGVFIATDIHKEFAKEIVENPSEVTLPSDSTKKGILFEHSITDADDLSEGNIYRYTITVKALNGTGVKESTPAQGSDEDLRTYYPTATTSIIVSILSDYAYLTKGENGDAGAITNATGYFYNNLNPLVASLLSSTGITETDPSYTLLESAAADHKNSAGTTDPQTMTDPKHLVLTDLENLPEGMSPYIYSLDMQLDIEGVMKKDPSTGEMKQLEVGDTVTVYRYDPAAKEVVEIEATVDYAYDANNSLIKVDGEPILCAHFSIGGSIGDLGVFAIGKPLGDDEFSYKITASSTGGGQITPVGEKTYTSASDPKFMLYPIGNYILNSITIKKGAGEETVNASDIEGNVYTFVASDHGAAQDDEFEIIANFIKVDPNDYDATYQVTASLTGEDGATGNLKITSGAKYRTIDADSGITVPEDMVVDMGQSEGPVDMPSQYGALLQFNPGTEEGDQFKLTKLLINGEEHVVLGDSYFLGVLTEDLVIEATYSAGLPDASVQYSVRTSIDEEDGANTALINRPDGSTGVVGTFNVNNGGVATVSVTPGEGYEIESAFAWINDSEEDESKLDITSLVKSDVDPNQLWLYNIVNDIKVVFKYAPVESTVTIAIDGTQGVGSFDPSSPKILKTGERFRLTIYPNDPATYSIGSFTMSEGGAAAVNKISSLTDRGDGKYTVTVYKKLSSQSKDTDGTWEVDGKQEFDNVIYIMDPNVNFRIRFDEAIEPAKEYFNISTSVGGIGNGTITPQQLVNPGEDAQVWFFPNEGYTVKSVVVDGEDVTENPNADGVVLLDKDSKPHVEFTNVQNDHTVMVTYTNGQSPSGKTYTIYPSAGGGGAISPASETKIYDGQNQMFNFYPMTGYVVDGVKVDGTAVPSDYDKWDVAANTFELAFEAKNRTIEVTFVKTGSSAEKIPNHNIVIKSEGKGFTSPSGTLSVANGSDLPIGIFPDPNYTVDSFTIKSLSNPDATASTLDPSLYKTGVYSLSVIDDYEINVVFRHLEDGETQSPVMNPDNTIVLGGQNSDVDDGAILTPETEGLTFWKQMSGNGFQDYASTSATFTVSVLNGKVLSSIKLGKINDEASMKEVTAQQKGEGVYTFTVPKESVTKDMFIQVRTEDAKTSIENVDTKTITTQVEGNGTISPSGIGGKFQVETGKALNLYFFPADGYKLDSVYINNMPVAFKNLSFTISAVTINTHVRAVFVEGVQSPSIEELGGQVTVRLQRSSDSADETGGLVSPSEATVLKGGSVSFVFKPEAGYEVQLKDPDGKWTGTVGNWTTDKSSPLTGATLALSNIQANRTIEYRFIKKASTNLTYHKLSVTTAGPGTASPVGTTMVLDGQSQTITCLPDVGNTVKAVTIDGNRSENPDRWGGASLSVSISNIKSDIKVHIEYGEGQPDGSDRLLRTLTAYANTGGTVSPGEIVVENGNQATFTFIPMQGYKLTEIEIDGGVANGGSVVPASSTTDGAYRITADGDHTLVGKFESDSANPQPSSTHYTIFVNAGENGAVSPNRAVSVPAGGSQSFTLLPSTGYKVDRLIITKHNNGTPTGKQTTLSNFSGNSYTIFNVDSDYTFKVEFIEGESSPVSVHNITATSSVGGFASPAGTTMVASGANSYVSFIPVDGYKLSYVVVDGLNIPAAMITRGQYVFSNVQEDHTIHGVFCDARLDVADFATVVVGSPLNGNIKPSGSVLVLKGGDQAFTISSNFGYRVQKITFGNTTITSNGETSSYKWDGATLTLKNIETDTNLTAVFEPTTTGTSNIPEYTYIDVDMNTGGQLSLSPGRNTIEKLTDGTSLDVSIIPDSEKAIASLKITYGDGTVYEPSSASALGNICSVGYVSLPAEHVNSGATIELTWRDRTDEDTFVPAKYHEIDASKVGGGTLTPSGRVKVANGASIRFCMVPESSYELISVMIDGSEQINSLGGSRVKEFAAGDNNDHSLVATFEYQYKEKDYFTITAQAIGQGKVGTSVGKYEEKVEAGASTTIYFFPDQGFHLTKIAIDGVEQEYSSLRYSFANIQEDHHLVATFEEGDSPYYPEALKVTAKVGAGSGDISPTEVLVAAGASKKFTLMPAQGFEVDYITFNGSNEYVSSGATTFTAIPESGKANELVVYYRMIDNRGQMTVTATVNVNVNAIVETNMNVVSGSGKVSPTKRQVEYGGSATFYIVPDQGSTLMSVAVNGVDINYMGLTDSETKQWHYTEGIDGSRYEITRSVNYMGDARTTDAVYRGGANTRTTELNLPKEGNTFYSSYMVTLTNITSDVTIDATFRKITEQEFTFFETPIHTVEVTTNAGGGGYVSPLGLLTLPSGAKETFTFTAFEGYYLAGVNAKYYRDGVLDHEADLRDQLKGDILEFTMGDFDVQIEGVFYTVNTEPPTVTPTLGTSKAPKFDKDGNIEYDDDGNVIYRDVHVTTEPPFFDENGNPISYPKDSEVTFTFSTSDLSENGKQYVIDTVYYNGNPVHVIDGLNQVTLTMGASGVLDIVWREAKPGEPIGGEEGFVVTSRVDAAGGGTIDPLGEQFVIAGHNKEYALTPDKGYLTSGVIVSWEAEVPVLDEDGNPVINDETGEPEMTVGVDEYFVSSQTFPTGVFTLMNVDRNYTVTAVFFPVIPVTADWEGEGYVSPNTASGEYIYVREGTSLTFYVAPYFRHKVISVNVDSDSMTSALVQTEEAHKFFTDTIGNRVVYFERGNGVANDQDTSNTFTTDEIADIDNNPKLSTESTSGGGIFSALANLLSGDEEDKIIENANANLTGISAESRSFARAYSFDTNPLALAEGKDSVTVHAVFDTDATQDPNDDKWHITGSVIANIGGKLNKYEDYVEHGGSVSFSWTPDPGFETKVLVIDGVRQLYSANEYVFTNVDHDIVFEVGFDSITTPGKNPTVNRIVRTLQALAQTGDLNGPAVILMLAIAAVAIMFVILSSKRTKRSNGGGRRPRGPRGPNGGGASGYDYRSVDLGYNQPGGYGSGGHATTAGASYAMGNNVRMKYRPHMRHRQ